MLLRCIKRLFDTNNNNAISEKELNVFLKTSHCIPGNEWEPFITGKLIMTTCDVDNDGKLTLMDWGRHDSCLHSNHVIKRLCDFCEFCK